MKKKIDIINILLILIIFILILIIILPPIFRKTIPAKIVEDDSTKKIAYQTLTCTKYDYISGYSIISKFKYNEDIPEENVISYKQMTEEELSKKPIDYNIIGKSALEEKEFLQNILGVIVEENEEQNETTLIIGKSVVRINDLNEELTNYFQSKNDQQKFYENSGYECKIEKEANT